MGVTLENIVPWGRSYEEYVRMFGLTEADLALRILGCGDGPAAFNSALTTQGGTIVSVDPVYAFSTEQIRVRISETHETVMAQVRENHGDYLWEAIPSVERLENLRMSTMEAFLADYDAGKQEGRYISGELPSLPFEWDSFDIALSSHFLFLYSTHLSAEFHLQAILEMLRVSREARVFPLLTLEGMLSPHLPFVRERLTQDGYSVEIERVPYEFQRGGNEMLVTRKSHKT